MRYIIFLCTMLGYTLLPAQDHTVTYQGQLQQHGAAFTGTADLGFRLFAQASGGVALAEVVLPDHPVVDGLFQAELDFGTGVFFGEPRWLEVLVNGNELAGRQRVTAAPMAVYALSGGDSHWQMTGSDIFYTDGRVGIGSEDTSQAQLQVIGGESRGVWGQTSGQLVGGVVGLALSDTGSGTGVKGQSNAAQGAGVSGMAIHSSGTTYGVRGSVSSPNGYAAYFTGPQDSRNYFQRSVGIGIANPLYQLDVAGPARVETDITGMIAVRALATGGENSTGVLGRSHSPSGVGVHGEGWAESGNAVGVWGQTRSSSGFAGYFSGPSGSRNYFERRVGIGTTNPNTMLQVVAPASTTAVRATHGNNNLGILGDTNAGVYGQLGGSGHTPRGWLGQNNAGVRGEAGTAVANALAGYFQGDVEITGNLSKASGTFRIDHPLDPENRYLQHSFVESPDMMNIYNGNVVTDSKGLAVVELPAYFEALNTDFRYQLTVIGSFSRAMVADEVHDNQFVIATEEPYVKVSWLVTGTRNDPFARANRVEVERPKPEYERGTLLHPEAWKLATEPDI